METSIESLIESFQHSTNSRATCLPTNRSPKSHNYSTQTQLYPHRLRQRYTWPPCHNHTTCCTHNNALANTIHYSTQPRTYSPHPAWCQCTSYQPSLEPTGKNYETGKSTSMLMLHSNNSSSKQVNPLYLCTLQHCHTIHGYAPTVHTPRLETRKTCPIMFSLVFDGFGVKCISKQQCRSSLQHPRRPLWGSSRLGRQTLLQPNPALGLQCLQRWHLDARLRCSSFLTTKSMTRPRQRRRICPLSSTIANNTICASFSLASIN
jgi:hypothetical protein